MRERMRERENKRKRERMRETKMYSVGEDVLRIRRKGERSGAIE